MLSDSVNLFNKIADQQHNILITTHYNPDGDAIGSSLALYHFLLSKGHTVNVLVPNDIPSFLKWMPGASNMTVWQSDPEKGAKLIRESDIIFCLDYNALHRVKLFTDQLTVANALRFLVDHHPNPEPDFDHMVSVTDVSSTSELLYRLITRAGYKSFLTREMAECLFVGIMTDTGSYSYSCNRPETFQITAELLEAGIDAEKIHKLVYDTYSESRMRLLGFCLLERMKVYYEYSAALIWLTREDLARFNYEPGDTEGVVNYALSIDNITLAALFIERDDRIRISLRSKGDFSVNAFARTHFNGGGHKNAAGADAFLPMEQALEKFRELLQLHRDELLHIQATFKG